MHTSGTIIEVVCHPPAQICGREWGERSGQETDASAWTLKYPARLSLPFHTQCNCCGIFGMEDNILLDNSVSLDYIFNPKSNCLAGFERLEGQAIADSMSTAWHKVGGAYSAPWCRDRDAACMSLFLSVRCWRVFFVVVAQRWLRPRPFIMTGINFNFHQVLSKCIDHLKLVAVIKRAWKQNWKKSQIASNSVAGNYFLCGWGNWSAFVGLQAGESLVLWNSSESFFFIKGNSPPPPSLSCLGE